jgi:hypothetical protein
MNSTRVPTIAFGAGVIAAHPASGSDQTSRPTESPVAENLPTFTQSRMPSGIADPALIENKAADGASARGESVNVARCGVPVSTTMRTRPEGRPI